MNTPTGSPWELSYLVLIATTSPPRSILSLSAQIGGQWRRRGAKGGLDEKEDSPLPKNHQVHSRLWAENGPWPCLST